MRYLSLFSGIEAASLAFHDLGWTPVAFAETDPFASAVLAHRFPDVPNLGDVTQVDWSSYRGRVDLVVGGSPCQSFSVAGLRAGLADPRGNLALWYLHVVDRVQPRWFLFENVPGLLTSSGGRDFGALLGAMGELGYGGAWRVLDAQYFGVPQRRRRLFLVGHSGADWERPGTVLFEPDRLPGSAPPRRQQGATFADRLENGAGARGDGVVRQPYNIIGLGQQGSNHAYPTEVTGALQHKGLAATGNEAGTLIVEASTINVEYRDPVAALTAKGICVAGPDDNQAQARHLIPVPVYQCHGTNVGPMGTLRSGNGNLTGGVPFAPVHDGVRWRVRRLTPEECEQLQGMPPGWTLVPYKDKPAADTPRYKAIGNSFAVPVVRWIAERIDEVDRSA